VRLPHRLRLAVACATSPELKLDLEVVLLSKLTRYFKPEIEISEAQQLRTGPARLEGVVVACESPLKTPFRNRSGVAYTYKVVTVVKMRQASMPSVIRDRLHCTSFVVGLDDVQVQAIPKKPGKPVTEEEHKEVLTTENAYVEEDVIPIGHKVRLEGMVERSGETWSINYRSIADLGPVERAPEKPQPRGRRRRKAR